MKMMKHLRTTGLLLTALLAIAARPTTAEAAISEALRVAEACTEDVARLCKGIVPGEGRIKACVMDKLSQLSPDCTKALAALIAARTEPPPDYLASATDTRFDGVRSMRYCEIFLIGGNPLTQDLYGEVFNTTQLNNKSNPLDTCPQAIWDKVSADGLKKQFDVLGVFKNGPRGWTTDWFHLPVAPAIHALEGLDTRWLMKVELPKGIRPGSAAESAYKTIHAVRNSEMTFEKGKPVFMLEDPAGTPWIMQAWSMIVDPKLSYDDLPNLEKRLKLPPGWKYRVKVLDQDLTIRAVHGIAHITQDELENTYDACFEEGGQKACSIQP